MSRPDSTRFNLQPTPCMLWPRQSASQGRRYVIVAVWGAAEKMARRYRCLGKLLP